MTSLILIRLVADFNQALKVAAKKDDVYYNIAKLIYGYQLETGNDL